MFSSILINFTGNGMGNLRHVLLQKFLVGINLQIAFVDEKPGLIEAQSKSRKQSGFGIQREVNAPHDNDRSKKQRVLIGAGQLVLPAMLFRQRVKFLQERLNHAGRFESTRVGECNRHCDFLFSKSAAPDPRNFAKVGCDSSLQPIVANRRR